jgi:hypothetical protein
VKKIKDNFITAVERYDAPCILAGGLGEGATVPHAFSLVNCLSGFVVIGMLKKANAVWASKEIDIN